MGSITPPTSLPKPPRAILCIHGGGASPAIFRFQLATFRAAMKNDFEFVYAEAPHVAVAGPDVLPFFAGMDPYYCWFRRYAQDLDAELQVFNEAIKLSVEAWQAGHPGCPIVGVLGFSQGGLASTMLLWEQRVGLVPWLPKLQFGILICCASSDVVTEYLREQSGGGKPAAIEVPTVHVHGTQDCNLEQAREMLALHYLRDEAQVFNFEGGHHVPKKWNDIAKITAAVRNIVVT